MAAVEGTRRRDVGATTHDLYRQYGKQIYAYCFRSLRSREEAEDAVQTTFMNAFRALQRGAETQFEQAWLFKIAHNVCIARSTSSARRLRLEAPNDFEVLQEIVPAQGGERPVELIGVEEALEAMPENQRRAILLREWQGLSYREIGEELGLSQAAVEMLIFRARRALAGALEQPEGKKEKKLSRKVGSAGSLLGALKTLLGGGTAIKAAAVAAAGAFAVVGESAQHTIVRHISSAPRIPAAATVQRHAFAVAPAAVFAPTRAEPSRAAVPAGAVHQHAVAAVPAKVSHVASAHPSSPLHVRPDGGVASSAAVPPVTASVPEPPPAPAVTTVAAAPAPAPAPAPPAPAAPAPAPPAKVAPPQVDRQVAQAPVTTATTTAAMPPATHDHGRRGNDHAAPIEQSTTTTTTTTSTTTTTPSPTPAPTPQAWHDNGRRGNDHVPPPDQQPAVTTTVVTTVATTTPTVTTPVAAPPLMPVAGHGRWGNPQPVDAGQGWRKQP